MLNQISNSIGSVVVAQIVPVIVVAIVALLLKEVAPVGDAAISFLRKKEEDLANKIGTDKYNADLAIAKNVWGDVDEEFRITPTLTKTIEATQAMFAEKMLKVIPGLSADDIAHLRQAVSGEINKGKNALTAPVEAKKVIIQPAEKYVAPDGTELVKATILDATIQIDATATTDAEQVAQAVVQ